MPLTVRYSSCRGKGGVSLNCVGSSCLKKVDGLENKRGSSRHILEFKTHLLLPPSCFIRATGANSMPTAEMGEAQTAAPPQHSLGRDTATSCIPPYSMHLRAE